MKLFRDIVGTLGVLLSVMPVAAWATKQGGHSSKSEGQRIERKEKVLILKDRDSARSGGKTQPICYGT
jgi:hypothetical protein